MGAIWVLTAVTGLSPGWTYSVRSIWEFMLPTVPRTLCQADAPPRCLRRLLRRHRLWLLRRLPPTIFSRSVFFLGFVFFIANAARRYKNVGVPAALFGAPYHPRGKIIPACITTHGGRSDTAGGGLKKKPK
jgi:hypothetical protein